MRSAKSTLIAGAIALLALPFCAQASVAQDASFGKEVWLHQANCSDCHGFLGDGNNEDPRAPRGANLRETALTQDDIVEVIMCGRPGTSMPRFDPKAYTAGHECYGMTEADVGADKPEAGAVALTKRHATGLAKFILETFAGKGPATKEQCVDLLGADAQRCATLPN